MLCPYPVDPNPRSARTLDLPCCDDRGLGMFVGIRRDVEAWLAGMRPLQRQLAELQQWLLFGGPPFELTQPLQATIDALVGGPAPAKSSS